MTMFLTAREVAANIGLSYAHFMAVRGDLERLHDFPQPMPFPARPLKWRADLVAHWITTQGLPRDVAAARPPAVTPALRLVAKAQTA